MIDQSNHPGINAYIERHKLQDASLAVERRAKKLNINGVKSEEQNDNAAEGGGEEESELQKAERELEDREDEEEEDYDPGSDGDSDGSGESSEEEEGGYNNDHNAQADSGRDLVMEELGSEAEDV